jgi:hypothetical protein
MSKAFSSPGPPKQFCHSRISGWEKPNEMDIENMIIKGNFLFILRKV